MSAGLRPTGALRLAELAGVVAAPAAGRGGGGSGGVPLNGAVGVVAEEVGADVLAAAAVEVTRQEARVDVKAGQVATVAGTLSTLAVGAATAVGALTPRGVPGWWAVPALLVVGGVLWASAVVVLLRRTIRPHLAGAARSSFASREHLEALRGMSLPDYHRALVTQLDGLVLCRYQAVRLAADLLVAGFVPLLASGLAAAVLAMGVA